MSKGPLCPNLSQKVQKEVSKMVNHSLSPVILLGGLSVNLNHLKMKVTFQVTILCDTYGKVSRSVRCPYNTSISVWSIAESGE